MHDRFLNALACCNEGRPPVWLMRQAGRYMPEYRRMREKHQLWEMFHEPELAVTVSLLPIDLLGVDAAILFSDILVIAEAMGLSVHFPEKGGPRIEPAIRTPEQVEALAKIPVEESLHYVLTTIRELKKQITIPLIGFCGGPFTVASYFIDSTSQEAFYHSKKWMENDPKSFHLLLDKITCSSIAYLKAQIAAGVNAVQIFDSWASVLTEEQFQEFCLPYLKQMIDALRPLEIPVIVFCRNSSLFPEKLAALNPNCISFDWHLPMIDLRGRVPQTIAIQGNLDPSFLKNSPEQIRAAVRAMLDPMRDHKGYIVNLGHGVLPDTPFEHVKCFVDAVLSYTAST